MASVVLNDCPRRVWKLQGCTRGHGFGSSRSHAHSRRVDGPDSFALDAGGLFDLLELFGLWRRLVMRIKRVAPGWQPVSRCRGAI